MQSIKQEKENGERMAGILWQSDQLCLKPQDEAHSIYYSLEIILQVKEQCFSNINEKFQSAEGNWKLS